MQRSRATGLRPAGLWEHNTPAPGKLEYGRNINCPGKGRGRGQGNGNMTTHSGSNNQGQAGQQTSGTNNDDIVSKLKALLSSLF